MANPHAEFPPVRLSDIDGLFSENVLDSSSGNKLIEFIRNRNGQPKRPRLNQLFREDDAPIQFRFDNVLRSPNKETEKSADAGAVTAVGSVTSDVTVSDDGVEALPPSPPVQIDSRVPSFLSPRRGMSSLVASPRNQRPATATIGGGSPNRSRLGRVTLRNSALETNLNRLAVLKECQRSNQLKCERLRQLISSTPNAGDRQERSDENFLNIKETISPISESPPLMPFNKPVPASAPQSPVPAATPNLANDSFVPATQDQVDGDERNNRATTPPRDHDVLIVPETPSPVRRSPSVCSTPLSGLRVSPGGRSDVRRKSIQQLLEEENGEVRGDGNGFSTPRQSILKKLVPEGSTPVRNRVSFATKLQEIREVSPIYITSPRDSDITSDESSEEEAAREPSASPKQSRKATPSARQQRRGDVERSNEKLQSSVAQRRLEYVTRSPELAKKSMTATGGTGCAKAQLATEGSEGNAPAARISSRVKSDRNKRSGDNKELQSQRSPLQGQQHVHEERQDSRALRSQETIGHVEEMECNKVVADSSGHQGTATTRANRTNRNTINMIIDEWDDETSAGIGNNLNEMRNNCLSSSVTNPVPIATIDTPRSIVHEIFEPPSAFGDDTDAAHGTSEAPAMETDGHQKGHVSPRKRSPEASLAPTVRDEATVDRIETDSMVRRDRITSASPHDQVSMKMLAVVDEILMNQEGPPVITGRCEDERRTTLNMQKKKRTTAKVDEETISYFKTVEAACKEKVVEKVQKRKERRKLFGKEMSENELPETVAVGELTTAEPMSMVVEGVKAQQTRLENEIRPVEVHVMRLSKTTIKRALNVSQSLVTNSNNSTPRVTAVPHSPVHEKQNTETLEKRSNTLVGLSAIEGKEDSVKVAKPSKKVGRPKPKKNPVTALPITTKDLKDAANGIRQQVDSSEDTNTIRRSHRNRRIPMDVLARNPMISQTDGPMYCNPNVQEIFKRCCELQREKMPKKSSKKRTKIAKKQSAAPPPIEEAGGTEVHNVHQKTKKKSQPEEQFDSEGFRIPPEPPKKKQAVQKKHPRPTEEPHLATPLSSLSSSLSHRSASPNGHDSGLGSAVMTTVSEAHTVVTGDGGSAAGKPMQPTNAGNSEDLLAQKRQTTDWMLRLMDNQQRRRPQKVPSAEVGYQHFSLDHLEFRQLRGVEYSFYTFSETEQFGFIRLPPNGKKNLTRAKKCLLRFLILNGSLTFTIENGQLQVKGGDFLILSTDSRYEIQNGPETSILFMMKTIVPKDRVVK
ncbi:uncharacterized protein LOC131207074 [Anopheles bellator]|uniref:uncharacterized protein LOC131207074 n=1 Tax=Anopheles bellator TaxID=139047 RepID=UPI00264A14DC|nr:uncharacterized protein LOC131207074 [Anopheles bellator]